jgi:hypothetical protein
MFVLFLLVLFFSRIPLAKERMEDNVHLFRFVYFAMWCKYSMVKWWRALLIETGVEVLIISNFFILKRIGQKKQRLDWYTLRFISLAS